MVTQAFKNRWVEKLKDGKTSRKRYTLGASDEMCLMAVARETAVELEILPDCDMTGRDLLTDEELKAIGISPETQYYLSTMNDTFSGVDSSKFSRRLINAIAELPVTKELVLIPVHKDEGR